MPGVRIEGQAGGGPGGPGGPAAASGGSAGSFGGYSISNLMAAENGNTAAFGSGGFMALHAMHSMNVSASLGIGGINPMMGIGGVHGAGLLGMGLAGMGPGLRVTGAAGGTVSPMAGGSFASAQMTAPILAAIERHTARSAQIEQEQLNTVRAMARPAWAPPGAAAPPPSWAPPGTMQALGLPPGIAIPPMPGGGGGSAAWPGWAVGAGGGGGGGGGGRGVGAGGGGGWRRGGRIHVPFASAVGLGATSELLTGGVTLAAAGYAAEELLSMPQIIGSKEGAALASAAPYFNLRMQTAALGRAGGFSGRDLMGEFYQGTKPPAWMARLGLGASESDKMLSDFGFVQGSAGASKRVVENLARMAFVPGLSGVSGAALSQSASEAASAGIVSGGPGGVIAFTRQLAPVLADAVAQGGNQIQILHTINQTMARAAAGGYASPLTATGIGRLIGQTIDAPGGPSGVAAMSLLQGGNRFLSGAGTQPIPTLTLATELPKTPAQMQALIDQGGHGLYATLMKKPGTPALMQEYFTSLKAGEDNTASWYLGNILKGVPEDTVPQLGHAATLAGYAYGSPDWVRYVSAQAGVTPQVVNAYLAGQNGHPTVISSGPGMGALGTRANNPLNLSWAHQTGASGWTKTTSGRHEAVFRNPMLGFMAAERQLLRDQGKGDKSITALLNAWTPGGQYNTAHAAAIASAMGVSPTAPINLQDPETMNSFVGLLTKIESPGALKSMPPGSLFNATANTVGGPGFGNMPVNTLNVIADIKAGGMFGSHTSAVEAKYLIPGLNAMVGTLVKGTTSFLNSLNKAHADLGDLTTGSPVPGLGDQ